MNRRSLASLAAVALACVIAPNVSDAHAPTTRPVVLPRAAQFDLAGPGGQTYRVWVAEPSGAPTTAPANGYATLFVLDANAMYLTAVEAARFQRGHAPALIVGIGYPADRTLDLQRRYRDFTPVTPDEHIWSSGTPGEERARPEVTGGQDEFLDFLEQSVRPAIAAMYPLDDSRRAIFGHSLAGRLVLHAMFTRPDSYTHYIAASPSIWWDDRSVLKEAEAFIADRQNPRDRRARPPISVLITAAEYEQKAAPGTPPGRIKFFEFAKMVDNARELSDGLDAVRDRGVMTTFIEYADENHGSVVPAVMSRTLRFALRPPTTQPAAR